jgi:hypothetical protein
MHLENQAKSLFQLQSELVETKVELSVSKAISQVVDQMVALRHEVHREINGLRHEMIERFAKVESRLASVETALGKRDQVRGEIRARLFDYTFKAAWMIGLVTLSAAVSSLIVLAHTLTQ